MTLLIAVVCGVFYWFGMSRIGYHFTYSLTCPISLGFILGLIYGDVETGLIIGANIQLVYLGVVVAGGNVPSDQVLAASIAIPIALATNITPEAAVAIAVPFGVLGVFLDQVKRTTNIYWLHKADKYAEQGNERGIFYCAFTYPVLTAFLYRFLPVFLINLIGPTAATYILEKLPTWIINGFTIAGGILPAMGFAMIIMVIGKRSFLPFFFVGYFFIAYSGLDMIGAAVFAILISLIYFFEKKESYDSFEKGVI